MSPIPASIVKSFKESQSLVSIEREEIDTNTIHGFIVDFDHDWILVQHVFDFYVDGWVLLRRSEISALQSKTTDIFQKELMREEGSFGHVDFTQRLPTGGIVELLQGFGECRVIILEEETKDDDMFYIGFARGFDEDDFFRLHFFSGAARLDDDETLIDLEDVTSISYGTNYALHYERYFDRARAK